MLERNIDPCIPAFAVLVMQLGMTVHESPAPGILTGQPHRKTGRNQRGIRQMLCHAPVHRHLAASHRGTVMDDTLDQRMQLEPFRHRRNPFREPFEFFHRHGRHGFFLLALLLENRLPLQCRLTLHIRHDRRDDRRTGIHSGTIPRHQRIHIRRRDDTLADQAFRIQAAHTRMHRDLLVHQWLRHRRRILFVMAELAVADDIDHHILAEFHPEIQRDLRGQHHRFRIVAIHMQNRCLDHLGNIGTVKR